MRMRTRPLTMIGVGLALAALDLRVVHVDIGPDFLGWALVAIGAKRLSMTTPAWLAGLAALAAMPDLLLEHHYQAFDIIAGRVIEDPAPGTDYNESLVFDQLSAGRSVAAILGAALGAAAIWCVLRELRRRALLSGDDAAARRLDVLRWSMVLVWGAPLVTVFVVQALGDGVDPVWNGGLELVALAGIAVALATSIELLLRSNEGWTATDDERVTPWGQMLTDGL
jgi:hypothetical protein